MRVHPSAFPLKTKKIMKKSLFMAAVLLLSLCMFTFSACDDNEEDKNVGKPVVALNEVGEENSKTAIAGSDLHLEGEITAENRIKRIDIEIHQEEGGEFRIEKSYRRKVHRSEEHHFPRAHRHPCRSACRSLSSAFHRNRPAGANGDGAIGTGCESCLCTYHGRRLKVRSVA